MFLSGPGNLHRIQCTGMGKGPRREATVEVHPSGKSALQVSEESQGPFTDQQSCARRGTFWKTAILPSSQHHMATALHSEKQVMDVAALIRESDPEPLCVGLEIRHQCPNVFRIPEVCSAE